MYIYTNLGDLITVPKVDIVKYNADVCYTDEIPWLKHTSFTRLVIVIPILINEDTFPLLTTSMP